MMNGRKFAWGALIFAVIFVLRLPALYTPILDVDESQFAGFADWLLHGGLPYVSSLDTKPLGIYWFFAAVFALFGRNNMIAVHAATTLWVGFTALLCYLIGRDIYSRRAGFFAALFYAVFTTTYVPKFISTSIVLVMMLPLTASIYACLAWERSEKIRWLWLSGILWGTASLFKYQAGINLVVMALYFMAARPLLADKKIRWRELMVFSAGGLAVGALFSAYLISIGVWGEFVRWSIAGSSAYIEAGVNLVNFWRNLGIRGGAFAASSLLLWILTAIAAVRILTRRRRDDERRPVEYLLLIWFLLSGLAVCTGGRFYGHYFIQLLPPMCILAGEVAARLRKSLHILIIAGLAVPAAGFFVARLYAGRIYAAIGEEDPAIYKPIAEYVKANTDERDMIFVWGFATPIYTFSNRLGASRFLWCDWLTGRIPGTPAAKDPDFETTAFIAPGSWELFFKDMRKNRPVYFIDTSPGNHHDYGKYPIAKFPALEEYLKDNYHLEASVSGADIYRRRAP